MAPKPSCTPAQSTLAQSTPSAASSLALPSATSSIRIRARLGFRRILTFAQEGPNLVALVMRAMPFLGSASPDIAEKRPAYVK